MDAEVDGVILPKLLLKEGWVSLPKEEGLVIRPCQMKGDPCDEVLLGLVWGEDDSRLHDFVCILTE